MFGPSDTDKVRALVEMARESLGRCNGNRVEGKEMMKTWLQHDRRFDDFNKDRLVDRILLNRYNGAVVDLTDGELLKNGSPRPLKLSDW
jgi:hypothetical protein